MIVPAGGCGKGVGREEPIPTGEVWTGTVKSSSFRYGFVACPEAKEKYGADVFCLGDQLAPYKIGETVQVEIGIQQSDAKPVAISVTGEKGTTTTFRDGSGKNKAKGKAKAEMMAWAMKGAWGPWAMWGPWGPWGLDPWGGGDGKGKGMGCMGMGGGAKGKGKGGAAWGGGQPHPGAGTPKRKPESTGEVFVGVVKSTSQKFGFISCQEITDMYGCDCFCLGEQLFGHFNQGDTVEFEVGINEKGQPQALHISYPDPAGGPPKKRLRATPLVAKPDDKPRATPLVAKPGGLGMANMAMANMGMANMGMANMAAFGALGGLT